MVHISSAEIASFAAESGFEIAGVLPVGPSPDFPRYRSWVDRGNAGMMGYLTDRRAELRQDVRTLLASAESVICVGKLYNGPEPYSNAFDDGERGWIARYAWGDDYHDVLRGGLERLAHALEQVAGSFAWKACVDTAPVLERSLARQAGLGWIGKNTCLINEQRGSWFFLGELITSLRFQHAAPAIAPDRCGSCSRCIDACPTQAIVPAPDDRYEIDARRCISYLTIELHGTIGPDLRDGIGHQIFGCDICQDVCPWNGRAPQSADPAFQGRHYAPPLESMAALTESEFRKMFRGTPVDRARYRGFLRNVAVAMGNSGSARMREPLRALRNSPDALIAEHAAWALRKLELTLEGKVEIDAACFESPVCC